MAAEAYAFHRNFEPSGPVPFRMERHYLLYAAEGTMRLEVEGRRWTLPPCRAALIAAGEQVTVTILSRLRSASVLFAPEFVAPPPQALAVFDVSPLAKALIAEAAQWGEEEGSLSPFAAQVFRLLAELAFRLSLAPSPCVMPIPQSPALARALAATEAQAAGSPRFGDIAGETGQSPRALARRFAEEIGMSWGEALRRIRVIRAVEALAMTADPVTSIAYDVGYASLPAFNAAFRALMGQTPGEYRASFRA